MDPDLYLDLPRGPRLHKKGDDMADPNDERTWWDDVTDLYTEAVHDDASGNPDGPDDDDEPGDDAGGSPPPEAKPGAGEGSGGGSNGGGGAEGAAPAADPAK